MGAPGRRSAFSTRSSTRRPTISSASSRRRGVGGLHGRDHLAAAHHRDTVGDGHDLAQLVGDEDDGLALALQLLEQCGRDGRLSRRQHPGRLVEDQDLGAAIERLEDLDALLQADRRSPMMASGSTSSPYSRASLSSSARRGDAHEQHAALGAEHDVLQHRERLHQHEVLVHHADPPGRWPRRGSGWSGLRR